ncbi:N-acetylmuramoyl-L-alanine amidase family protein, partial [Bacillus mycoides]|uniref:N-acetylmuramoyl-L-alanine amidase family protein n=1 Tax=Bacillus mycoides TaxID=1405 RepID=UPI00380DC4FD
KKYYFGKKDDGSKLAEGQMATAWFQVGNDWYRAETDGKLNVGILESGSDKYFFDKTTGKSLFSIRSGYHYYGYGPGGDNATRIHGFYESEGKKYYFGKKEDGTGLGEGQMATGFQTIDGKKYYFGKKDDGSGLGGGQMSTGFQTIDGKKYYFGKSGDKLFDGSKLVEGQMATGWFQVGNDWYKAEKDGTLYLGTQNWSGDIYFFDKSNGKHLFSIRKQVLKTTRGQTYLYKGYNADGHVITGEHVTSEGTRYWFSENGFMQRLFFLNGKLHIQTLEHGIPKNTTKLIKVGTSASKEKAVSYSAVFASPPLRETFSNTSDLATSYLLAFDKDGAVIPTKHEGQKLIDWYKAHHTGDHSNDPNTEEIEEEENGFYKEESGKTFYFAEKDDEHHKKGDFVTGWKTIKDSQGKEKTYYFAEEDDDHHIEEGEMATGFHTIDGKTYYFGKKDDGTGLAEGQMATYFVRINGKSHYFSGDGSAWAANSWLADYNQAGKPNTWYILEKGEMASGFKQIDGKMYYFDSNNSSRMSTGFQTIEGKQYYFGKKEDGTGLAEGERARWTVNINGKLHYFSGDGSAWAANSWLADYNQDDKPNTWYILEKGEMASGFKQIDGKTYYFDPNNRCRMSTGFQTIEGKQYYFGKKEDGTGLAEGERARWTVNINGKLHYFSGDGSAWAANSWLADYNQDDKPNTWYIL